MSNARSWILLLVWMAPSSFACSSNKNADDDSVGGSADRTTTSSSSTRADSGGSPGSTTARASATGGERHSATTNTRQGSGGASAASGDSTADTGKAIGGASNSSAGGGASGTSLGAGGTANSTVGGRSSGAGGWSAPKTTATGGNAPTTSSASEPSAQDLLDKVAACGATSTAIKSGFGLDGGSGDLSMYRCGNAVYWKADMDVDCDGIQTPPCDTDEQGQPQTSIVDDAPNGDVDPTKLPYIVIPLGEPETNWYVQYGIGLGQVGAVIYHGSVHYGIFADEAGGAFIGEASYAMCQLFLGKPTGSTDPCDPNEGGIDPAEVTYVTFTGEANRATDNDIYSHDKHTTMGIAAAKAWIAP